MNHKSVCSGLQLGKEPEKLVAHCDVRASALVPLIVNSRQGSRSKWEIPLTHATIVPDARVNQEARCSDDGVV